MENKGGAGIFNLRTREERVHSQRTREEQAHSQREQKRRYIHMGNKGGIGTFT